MKKFLISLALIFLVTPAFATSFYVADVVTPDDVTLTWLNGFKNTVINGMNSFPGANIVAGSISQDAMDANGSLVNRWEESFNDYVYTGLLPTTTSGTLTSTTTAGTAYISGYRVVKVATAHLYTATKWTFVDLSKNGVYTYSETAIGAAEPSVTTDSIRLCRVTTDGTEVTAVRDDRVTTIQIGSTNEDFYIADFELAWGSTTTITADAGFLNVGSSAVSKTSATGLTITSATDYIGGASQQGTSKWLYVYINSSGSIKLYATAPNYHDTSGNTTGILYYYKDGTTYYRCIGAIRLNSTGAGEVDEFYQQGDYVQYGTGKSAATGINSATFTDVDCSALVPPITRNIMINIRGAAGSATAGKIFQVRPNGSASTNGQTVGVVDGDNCFDVSTFIATDSSQVFEARFNDVTGGPSANIDVLGYRLRIR